MAQPDKWDQLVFDLEKAARSYNPVRQSAEASNARLLLRQVREAGRGNVPANVLRLPEQVHPALWKFNPTIMAVVRYLAG